MSAISYCFFFCFKQKTAYEMRISDWSSDVCSSDLGDIVGNDEAEDLVDRHLHAPYAYPALRQTLHDAAVESVQRYLDEHGSTLDKTVHSEKEIQDRKSVV